MTLSSMTVSQKYPDFTAVPASSGDSVSGASISTTASPAPDVNTMDRTANISKSLKKAKRNTYAHSSKIRLGPDPTSYKYKTAEYKPPGGKIAMLWLKHVSGPFKEWRKQKAEERRHPVLKYFEARVVQYEANRLAKIVEEYQLNEE